MPYRKSNPADYLHSALDNLLETIDPPDFPTVDKWQIGYGPASLSYIQSPYWDPMDSHDFPPGGDNQTTVLRLLYSPTGATVRSDWISHTNYVSIRFGSRWDQAYDQDDNSRDGEKYMIGGPLCDPVVTGDVETAANAVRKQLPRIEAGMNLNHIFEVLESHRSYVLTSETYRDSLPDFSDLPEDLFDKDTEATSPLYPIPGIGPTTIKRFATRFGVYPNLCTAERDDLREQGPGWNHSPDLDEMEEAITTLTEYYQELCEQPEWSGPVIDPAEFTDYPIGNPSDHGHI